MRSLLRCVPKPSRSWLGGVALAGALGLASTGWAATGASGQGVGLEVTANAVLPSLLNLPLADTGVQTAPPDPSFDETVSTVNLASGVNIGIARLSAGLIQASTSGTLNKNKVDSEAGLISDSGNPGLGLKVGIPSLLNVLDVGATTIKSEAHGICVNGTPEFSSSTTIADLKVDTLLGNLLSLVGEVHPDAGATLLNADISIPNPLPFSDPIVIGSISLKAHDRTVTSNRIEVNALRLGVRLLGNVISGVDVLNLDLKIGTSMAELDNCEAPEDGGVSISIDAPIINAGNQNAVPVSGICTPGSADDVHITAADGESTTPDATATAQCSADGTYSTTVDASGLVDGIIEFTAQQDNATDSAKVPKDATAPAVTVDPDDIDADNQDEYTVGGTCTAGDGEVTVTIGSGDNAITLMADCDDNGEWETEPTDVSGQPEGDVPVQACQTDAADNEGCGEGTANKDTSGSGNGDDDGGDDDDGNDDDGNDDDGNDDDGNDDDGNDDDDNDSINAIPTASEWTLILMGLLLAGLGAMRFAPGRRKFS